MDMVSHDRKRQANVLLHLTEKVGPEILRYLEGSENVNLTVTTNVAQHVQLLGHKLARWADLLVVVADAGLISSVLNGTTNSLITHLFRCCWDTSKKILLIPQMSIDQYKNPMTKEHISLFERRWDWVQISRPVLWDLSPFTLDMDIGASETAVTWAWDGPSEIVEALLVEADIVLRRPTLIAIDKMREAGMTRNTQTSTDSKPRLPTEIWTMILDRLGDWELGQALQIYTHLPVPYEWRSHLPQLGKSKSLEYTILTSSHSDIAIRSAFENSSASVAGPSALSPLATKLIFKFSLTSILSYLALHQKDVFWTTFPIATLPHKASYIFPSPQILQWWLTFPSILKKDYGPEALDSASRAGYVDVLSWWLHSGLPLEYTERALESASAKGRIDVLDWWRDAHESRRAHNESCTHESDRKQDIPLKVGKSILAAAQSGHASAIEWWNSSGIPFSHEDGVTKLASAAGHLDVLRLWHSLKGSKMIFDSQVLVGPTKNGHVEVLQFWKDTGLRIEYKTPDVEEAMEDAVPSRGQEEVRQWWAENNLNLGVGTGEWMKTRVLGGSSAGGY